MFPPVDRVPESDDLDDLSIGPIVTRVVADLVSRYVGLFAVVVALLLVATLMPSRVIDDNRPLTAGLPPGAQERQTGSETTPVAGAAEVLGDPASCPTIPGPVPAVPPGVAATLLGLVSPLLAALGPFSAGAIPLLGVIAPLLEIIAPIAGKAQPFLDRVYPSLVKISETVTALWEGSLKVYVPRLMEVNETTFLPFVRRLLEVSGPIVDAIGSSSLVPCLQIIVTRLAGGPSMSPQP